jgi:hypothetical protein
MEAWILNRGVLFAQNEVSSESGTQKRRHAAATVSHHSVFSPNCGFFA